MVRETDGNLKSAGAGSLSSATHEYSYMHLGRFGVGMKSPLAYAVAGDRPGCILKMGPRAT